MQTIVCKSNHDIVGLIVIPENGEYLLKSEAEDLLPYVKYVIEQYSNLDNIQDIINSIEITDKGYHIPNIDHSIIKDIIKICHKYLTENVIVPQDMERGPTIRHRPLYFGKGKSENCIDVKFTILGDFNTLNLAFNDLDNKYPVIKQLGPSVQDVVINNL